MSRRRRSEPECPLGELNPAAKDCSLLIMWLGSRKLSNTLRTKSIDVTTRIMDVQRGGRLHPRGFGKNIATGILHACDGQDQYGLWYTRTEEALKILKRKTSISQDLGLSYARITTNY